MWAMSTGADADAEPYSGALFRRIWVIDAFRAVMDPLC